MEAYNNNDVRLGKIKLGGGILNVISRRWGTYLVLDKTECLVVWITKVG